MQRLTRVLCLGLAIAALSGGVASASPPTPAHEVKTMGTSNQPDTPREAEVRSILGNVDAAQSAALSSARGAIDRMGAQAEALKQATVDDETLGEFNELATKIVDSAKEAGAAFDKIGVESPAPIEDVPVPQSRRSKGRK